MMIKLLALFLLGPVANVFAANECGVCQCCTNSMCDSRNVCTQGCIDGYYGEGCFNACTENCLRCTNSTYCTSCKDGFYPPYCNRCQLNCLTCSNYTTCQSCKDGYYSGYSSTRYYGNCGLTCNTKCAACSSYSICTKCNEGKYGAQCDRECSEGCNRCDFQTGNCIDECLPGDWGDKCQNKCPSTCKTCSTYINCSLCKNGFYGAICNVPCPKNCADNICDKTSGTCFKCGPGYFGRYCNNICPSNCFRSECNFEGACSSCKTGFYSNNCTLSCPGTNCGTCHMADGVCTKCVNGYYGSSCEIKCPGYCKDGSPCSKSDGSCSICSDSFYYFYRNCDSKCDAQCRTCNYNSWTCTKCRDDLYNRAPTYSYYSCNLSCSKKCTNSTCDDDTGHCFYGCTDGYTGNKCKCPTNCHCNVNEECIACNAGFYNYKDNCSGKCNDYDEYCSRCTFQNNMFKCLQCHSGYYPSNVTNSCLHCSYMYHCVNETCNSSNGICSNGCKPGRWGERCERLCSNYCEQCNQESGDCEICTSGKYFKDCSKSCSDHCNSTGNVGVCGIDDGQCLNGCATSTWHGSHCENQCSSNCKTGNCEWTTGKCLEGCVNNTLYGAFCNNSCSHNCIRDDENVRTCDESNGYCIGGCVNNFYGDTCEKECSPNCATRTCDRSSGDCLTGLSNGYSEKNNDANKINIIMAACLGAFGLIIIGLVVAILYLIRRARADDTKADTQTKDRKNVYDSPLSVKDEKYENLPTEELKTQKTLHQIDNATFTNVTLNDGNIKDLAVDVQDNSITYGCEHNKYEVLGDRGRANSSDYSSISPYENA